MLTIKIHLLGILFINKLLEILFDNILCYILILYSKLRIYSTAPGQM